MDNIIMPNMTECVNAVVSGCAYPRFSMTTGEAEQIVNACTKAGIRGQLMDKMQTILCYCSAKAHFSGRETRISIE